MARTLAHHRSYPRELYDGLCRVFQDVRDVKRLYRSYGADVAKVHFDQAVADIWDEILARMDPDEQLKFVEFLIRYEGTARNRPFQDILHESAAQIRRSAAALLQELLIHYPPLRASAITDQRDVGIDPSPIADNYRRASGWPPYVDRDVDGDLDRALHEEPFVVLVGASKEGKSRTLFEAVKRIPGDPFVAIPREPQPVDALVEQLADTERPLVVWLDKLEQHDLPVDVRRSDGVQLVGTIENDRWNEIMHADDPTARDEFYEKREALRFAREVRLLEATDEELARALAAYKDEDAFEIGIGQHFVAAKELRDRFHGAPVPSWRAVVRAVVDWQRTGMPQAIVHDDLDRLARLYLGGADPERAVAPALEWATTELRSGHKLLAVDHPFGEARRYRTPDHVVEYVGRDAVPDAVWELAAERATPQEALAIGQRAADLDANEQAATLLRQAREGLPAGDTAHRTATSRLALIMRRLGDDDAAVELFQEAIAAGSLAARNNYGFMLMRSRKDPAAAEEVLAPAVAAGNRTAAFNLLEALALQAALDRAPQHFNPAIEAGNVAAALNLGMVEHAQAKFAEAERLYRAAEQGKRSADARFAVRARMMRAILAAQRGDRERARGLWRQNFDPEEWERTEERLEQAGVDGYQGIVDELSDSDDHAPEAEDPAR